MRLLARCRYVVNGCSRCVRRVERIPGRRPVLQPSVSSYPPAAIATSESASEAHPVCSLTNHLPEAPLATAFCSPKSSLFNSSCGKPPSARPLAPASASRPRALARARLVAAVRLSAQPSADRSVQRLIRRRRWTAPALRWAARPPAGPPAVRLRVPTPRHAQASGSAPQGAAAAGTGCARATDSSHPHTPSRGGSADRACAPGGQVAAPPGCVLLAALAGGRPSPVPPPGCRGTRCHGRPLAAAERLPAAATWFFLLGRPRNLISARSCVKARCAPRSAGPRLDPRSLRLGSAASEGKTTNAAATGRRRGQGPYSVFLPPDTRARRGAQGGAQVPAGGPLQHTALTLTQPSDEGFFLFLPPTT